MARCALPLARCSRAAARSSSRRRSLPRHRASAERRRSSARGFATARHARVAILARRGAHLRRRLVTESSAAPSLPASAGSSFSACAPRRSVEAKVACALPPTVVRSGRIAHQLAQFAVGFGQLLQDGGSHRAGTCESRRRAGSSRHQPAQLPTTGASSSSCRRPARPRRGWDVSDHVAFRQRFPRALRIAAGHQQRLAAPIVPLRGQPGMRALVSRGTYSLMIDNSTWTPRTVISRLFTLPTGSPKRRTVMPLLMPITSSA